MFAENLDVFFGDFGSIVEFDGVTAPAIFDMPSEIIAGGMVISTDYKITFKTGALSIKHGDQILVDGAAYKVRDTRTQADGATSEAFLSKL